MDALAAAEGAATIQISAAIEEEIAQMDAEDQAVFLADLGLEEAGLDRLIRAGYAAEPHHLLHLWTQRSPRLDGA